MKTRSGDGRTAIIITAIICITLVLFAGIGAFLYTNQQNLAQKKELKEKEIKAANEQATKECIGNAKDGLGRLACE